MVEVALEFIVVVGKVAAKNRDLLCDLSCVTKLFVFGADENQKIFRRNKPIAEKHFLAQVVQCTK